jgi:RimJ/RimL family protein N-acetyltransferase
MSNPADDVVTPVPLQVGPYRLDGAAASDHAEVVAAFQDPDIALWNPAGNGGEDVDLEEWATLWIARRSAWSSEHASWVARASDGTIVGQVSLFNLDHVGGTAEVGYWLTPRGRGRGLGAAMLDAATTYAFDELGIFRIELFHAVENEPSCRMALRCGYLLEGLARQSYRYGDGQRHDEHLHAVLATDARPEVRPPA